MTEITVNASKKYTICIDNGILSNIGNDIKALGKYEKAVIVTDDVVDSLYADTVTESVENVGITTAKYVIKNGEASKNAENYIAIINFLAENNLTRSDLVIALGGGVVGDLTGFAASTYLRGIDFVQIPTTLLSMVDSSVGGKTAIDLKSGKNLCGSFYQPKAVFCDLETLNTLAENVFSDGSAEVIKYGMIQDSELYAHLSERGMNFDREYVISRCVDIKRYVVENDEFDKGMRQLLNFGHTVGHAIEILSGFEITHGSAVAIGMCVVTNAVRPEFMPELTQTLKQFKLPVKTEFKAEELEKIILSDKKRFGETINLIVPNTVGECVIKPTPVSELTEFLNRGLKYDC